MVQSERYTWALTEMLTCEPNGFVSEKCFFGFKRAAYVRIACDAARIKGFVFPLSRILSCSREC